MTRPAAFGDNRREVMGTKGQLLLVRCLQLGAVALALTIAACGHTAKSTRAPSGASTAVAGFNRLPAPAFPAIVSRDQAPETGALTTRMTFLGQKIALITTVTSVGQQGTVGTVTRTGSDFVLRLLKLQYSVEPIKLPNGLTIARQTIALNPNEQSTLLIDRHSGAVTSDVHWLVNGTNVLYNGSHTISIPDMGQRRFLSFKSIGTGRYSFKISSTWSGSVALTSWSVQGRRLPPGRVEMSGSWNGSYLLTLK